MFLKPHAKQCKSPFATETLSQVPYVFDDLYYKHRISIEKVKKVSEYLSNGSVTSLLIYLLTYLLTLWCRVLLEKLTGLQLVKKFLAFHRTRKFITALTSVRYLSLS